MKLKNEILIDYKGDFKLNGLMVIGPVGHETNIRLRNKDGFRSHINELVADYDSGNFTFTGNVYKVNTQIQKC